MPAVAAEVGASTVFATGDCAPYGRRRDARVAAALAAAGRALVRTGSPYAVSPGRVLTGGGDPLPGLHPVPPALGGTRLARSRPGAPTGVTWASAPGRELAPADLEPDAVRRSPPTCPAAGERAATEPARPVPRRAGRHLRRLTGTARTSTAPPGCRRTCGSARCTPGPCWPGCRPVRRGRRSARSWPGGSSTPTCCGTGPTRPGRRCRPVGAHLRSDAGPEADARFAAWAEGRTGFPLVDAGMRQLRAEGWMHNRVRMLAASFLVKDLHLPWQRGAALLPRPPGRRRPGLQQPRLAVGGRHRDRCRALPPGLQPRPPGRAVRPRRRLRGPLRAGARDTRLPGPDRRPRRPSGSRPWPGGQEAKAAGPARRRASARTRPREGAP